MLPKKPQPQHKIYNIVRALHTMVPNDIMIYRPKFMYHDLETHHFDGPYGNTGISGSTFFTDLIKEVAEVIREE